MSPATPADRKLAASERQRARLGIQIEALQATLVRLLQDVVDAEARLASRQQADTAAAALTEAERLGSLDAQAQYLTASGGVAIYPENGEDLDALSARADAEPARQLAELREANERLVLAALGAQELQAAAERAHARQLAFMAAVADELGNPLAPIRIASGMLGRLPGEEPLLPRVRQVIEQQMAQMSRLVGRLVEGTAAVGGGLILEHTRVDIVAVVQAAVATCRPVLQRHRLRLDWHAPASPIVTIGDAARLELIVANLLDHACTHTPAGGRIAITLASGAGTLTLTVADNGLGIPAQALAEVFDPFVLDLHALDFNGVGLGIGLAVARALVQAHGGSISAHSAGVRRGTEFVVTLPLAPDLPAAVAPPAAGAGP